jgi:hypothetical protein
MELMGTKEEGIKGQIMVMKNMMKILGQRIM